MRLPTPEQDQAAAETILGPDNLCWVYYRSSKLGKKDND
jgi:hypothetical protein